ncbi:MAG TPA: C4-dicarboxylate ABC transporter [Oceanospirillaceae bacterium]|nr:C4-dicarboxylate ABC transporter [Oceanospirillaceae bacterium]
MVAWVYIALIIAIIAQIILRRGFHNGMIALEELQWHLYAIGVMFGMVYTQVENAHVRVDILHQNMKPRTKHWVEIFGLLFLAMPFIGTVLINSFDFVYEAWRVNESSDSPSGLPYRWIIKGVIPASCSLLLLAMFTRLLRSIDGLRSPTLAQER